MKPIKIDANLRQQMLAEFQQYLVDNKFTGLDINFKRDFSKLLGLEERPKPIIMFTTEAWVKMQTLVQTTATEIGWHGIVQRKENIYLISDIILYPQMLTATTVTTDTEEYGKWCCDLSPTRCNQIRFQGHSHVSMSASPSGVDLAYYDDILSLLRKTEYYIFMILNKKGELNLYLYDLATNAVYETKDLIWTIVDKSHHSLSRWAEENIKAFCKPRPIATTSTYLGANAEVGNTNVSDRDLLWSYNAVNGLIQMERRYTVVCAECNANNAQSRVICGKCGSKLYSTKNTGGVQK